MVFYFFYSQFHGGKLAIILLKNKKNEYFCVKHIRIHTMNKIGEQLKHSGQKQKWLAEKLGMSPVMISLYVQNKRQPKLSTIISISRILNVEVNSLIDSTR